jgi:hypothetical protein
LFREVARLSKLKTDPKWIYPGQQLLIPKNYKSVKTSMVKTSTEKKVGVSEIPVKFNLWESPTTEFSMPLDALFTSSNKIVTTVTPVKRSDSVVTVDSGHDTVKIVVEVPKYTKVETPIAKPRFIREGLYKIAVNNGMKVGIYPAVVVSKPDDQERWERKETVADVRLVDGGKLELWLPVNKTMPASKTSFLVFDLGDGNATIVSSEDLVGADSFVPGKMEVVPFEKKKYAALHEGFRKKPNFVKKLGKGFLKIGVPSVLGFFTGGPVGAALPVGYAVVNQVKEKSQRNAARKLAQMEAEVKP